MSDTIAGIIPTVNGMFRHGENTLHIHFMVALPRWGDDGRKLDDEEAWCCAVLVRRDGTIAPGAFSVGDDACACRVNDRAPDHESPGGWKFWSCDGGDVHPQFALNSPRSGRDQLAVCVNDVMFCTHTSADKEPS